MDTAYRVYVLINLQGRCGPPMMIKACTKMLAGLGVAPTQIASDGFEPRSAPNRDAPRLFNYEDGIAFVVRPAAGHGLPMTKTPLLACLLLGVSSVLAQTPPAVDKSAVPDWAWPGSATHKQVAPPPDFHRPSRHYETPIGIFDAQSDIGAALVEGSATFDPATRQYTIVSAGYNVWYTRDEFRYLWKKMSGDVSLAASIAYPDANGYGDRKAVLVIRQDLEDDAKQVVVALHGAGMIQLAQRAEKGIRVKDLEFRIGGRGRPGGANPDSLVPVMAQRLGLEKRGDAFALLVSLEGEPMHQFGPPIKLPFTEPFYAGIGFCSHLPDQADTAVLSDVVLENQAGGVR